MRPHLAPLTSLRFFAALGVVLYHHLDRYGARLPLLAERVLSRGHLGVDFFFVLSGFILVYTYAGRGEGARPFWRARLARLYPLYVVGLVLAWPLFEPDLVAGVLSVAMLQAWDPSVALAWNPPGWSLACEAMLYVAFPLVLRLLERTPRRALLPLAALCVAVRAASVLAMPDPYYSPLARFPEFALGAVVGSRFLRGVVAPRGLGPLSAALLLALLAAWPADARVPVGLAALPLFATLVLGFARPGAGRALAASWLVLLGEASYALYILHTPLLYWLRVAAQRVLPDAYAPALAPVYLAALVGLCVLAHLAVEKPARRLLLRPHARSDTASRPRTTRPSAAYFRRW